MDLFDVGQLDLFDGNSNKSVTSSFGRSHDGSWTLLEVAASRTQYDVRNVVAKEVEFRTEREESAESDRAKTKAQQQQNK